MSNPVDWGVAPAALSLARDEVQVWRIWLEMPSPRIEQLQAILDCDERERAARFHFDKDRQHFIVAHAAMRMILGAYLHLDPAHVQFGYNAYGKPELSGNQVTSAVRFNLSHSGGLALLAVTRGRDLGIDVEHVRPVEDAMQIAQRFFSPQEVSVLRHIPSEWQRLAFFNCWTRKEAYIKARGCGLSLPLDTFDVTLAPDEAAALLVTRDDPNEAAKWRLCALDPGPGYVAAVAVAGHVWKLRCWHWKG